MDRLNPHATDGVSSLLNAIKVHSSVFCLSDLGAPWGFEVGASTIAKFHLVLEGKCWLQPERCDAVLLGDGDLVVLPHGTGHAMRDDPGSSVVPLDKMTADYPLDEHDRLSNGGTGTRTRLLCGGFGLSDTSDTRWLSRLPDVIVLDSAAVGSWSEPLVSLARLEADHVAPGSQAIFTKLADVLLSQALRTQLNRPDQRTWNAADNATRVDQAVRLLAQHPDRPWTLRSLAREAGMSKTQLAAGFRAAMGDSPMRHLAAIRLNLAAWYLVTSDKSVEAIARRTGYASGASLSKAFRREFGVPPGTYRAGTPSVSVSELESAR
jgi:AraC-like DNA-binding protein